MNMIYLHTGFNCNLKCKYCFQNSAYGNPRPKEKKITQGMMADFVTYCHMNGFNSIQLYGGEPFFHKDLVLYLTRKLLDGGGKMTVGIVTNGTLIDEEIMDFLEECKIPLLLSLDGTPERHNALRGGFGRISPWFPRLAGLNIGVATQAGIIARLSDQVSFIWSLGLEKVFINIIETYGWYKRDDVGEFEREYEKLILLMLEGKGRLNCALQIAEELKKEKASHVCGLIRKGYACDARGDIYPCHRAVELGKRFAIGNISKGIDTAREKRLRARIEKESFDSGQRKRYPNTSFCPVEIYKKHGTFSGKWNREFAAMIEIKAKLVAKYFHQIDAMTFAAQGGK